jgi:hypothetical protein
MERKLETVPFCYGYKLASLIVNEFACYLFLKMKETI